MTKSKENVKQGYNIGISDWLQYLEYKSSISSSHMFSFWSVYFMTLAILLSATILLNSVDIILSIGGIDLRIILGWCVFLFAVLLFVHSFTFNRYSKQAMIRDSAERLLNDILFKHEYQTVKKIEEKWEEEMKNIKLSSGWLRKKSL